MTSLFLLTVGTSATGLMSTSRSNGQPQSWQAVNQRNYRKPLVQGYTIKSGNGLIKPATPQQTFWFCLLRGCTEPRMSENKEAIFLLCIVAWGLVLVINVQWDALRWELFIYTVLQQSEYQRRTLWLWRASIELHVTDASLIYCELVINARCAPSAGW